MAGLRSVVSGRRAVEGRAERGSGERASSSRVSVGVLAVVVLGAMWDGPPREWSVAAVVSSVGQKLSWPFPASLICSKSLLLRWNYRIEFNNKHVKVEHDTVCEWHAHTRLHHPYLHLASSYLPHPSQSHATSEVVYSRQRATTALSTLLTPQVHQSRRHPQAGR